jgi:hypothetical protein
MPLIDQQTIDSLRRHDGSHSQFSLFLLGAVPQGHLGEPIKVPAPNWERKIICTKISKVRLRCIKGEARRIARMNKKQSQTPRPPNQRADPTAQELPVAASGSNKRGERSVESELRALKRKLATLNKRQAEVIEEIEQIVHHKAA